MNYHLDKNVKNGRITGKKVLVVNLMNIKLLMEIKFLIGKR